MLRHSTFFLQSLKLSLSIFLHTVRQEITATLCSRHVRPYVNSFPSSDIDCKVLEGQGQRMLAWRCSDSEVNNERLLDLGKDSQGPGFLGLVGDLEMNLWNPEKAQYWRSYKKNFPLN